MHLALLDHICHAARGNPEHQAAVGPDLVSPLISCGVAGHAGNGQRRGVRVSAWRPGARRPGAATAGTRDVCDGPCHSCRSPRTLVIPIPPLTEARLSLVLPLAVSIVLLSVPFFLSGVAVTIALTRLGAPIGRLYAWDLAGAAAGCLCVIPLLVRTNLTSAMFAAAAATALAAWCFARVAGRRRNSALVLAALLVGVAGWNGQYNAFPVLYPEEPGTLADGRQRGRDSVDDTRVRGPGPAG